MRIVLLLNSVYYYCRKVVEDPVRPSGGVMGGGKISPCDTDTGTDRRKKKWTDPAGWVGPQPHYVKSNGRSIDCRTTVVVWVWGSFYIKRGDYRWVGRWSWAWACSGWEEIGGRFFISFIFIFSSFRHY